MASWEARIIGDQMANEKFLRYYNLAREELIREGFMDEVGRLTHKGIIEAMKITIFTVEGAKQTKE